MSDNNSVAGWPLFFMFACIASAVNGPAAEAPERSGLLSEVFKVRGALAKSLTFRLDAGHFGDLNLSPAGIEVALRLYDSRHRLLVETAATNGPFAPQHLYWVSASGDAYRLEITALRADADKARCSLTLTTRRATARDNKALEAQRLYTAAEELTRGGRTEPTNDARSRYEEAVTAAAEAGLPFLEAAIRMRFASRLGESDDWGKALEQNKAAERLATASRNSGQVQYSLAGEAEDLVHLGRYDDAEGPIRSALHSDADAPDDPYLRAILDKQLGTVAVYAARYRDAIGHFQRALDRFTAMKIQSLLEEQEDLEGDIALCYQSLGDNGPALRHYERSLEISAGAGDNSNQSIVLDSIGRIRQEEGDYAGATAAFERSIHYALLAQDQRAQAIATQDLAYGYRLLGELTKSLEEFTRLRETALTLADQRLEESVLNDMAGCYRELRRYDESIRAGKQSLALATSLKDLSGKGSALSMLGLSYAAAGRYDEAIAADGEAKTLFVSLGNHSWEGTARTNLAIALLGRGEIETAISEASRSLIAATAANRVPAQARAMEVLMDAYARSGRASAGIFWGKLAVNLIQTIRANVTSLGPESRHDFVTANAGTYRKLADLLISSGRLPEAEQVLDLLKEREFLEFLRGGSDDATHSSADLNIEETSLEKRYLEIQSRLVSLSIERDSMLAKADRTQQERDGLSAIENDIANANDGFQRFLDVLANSNETPVFAAKVTQLRDRQALMEDLHDLPPGTVAVYTIVGRKTFRAILITPDVEKAFEYPISEADLNRKILAFRALVQDPNRDPRPASRELYDILVGPLIGDLRALHAHTVMWELDGNLRYLPLSALYDGKQYLVEQYALSIFTPASNARLKERPTPEWQAVGFGVTKALPGAPALPEVTVELRGIVSEKWPAEGILRGDVYLDDQFTEPSFRSALQKRYPVVHVASHFFFQPGDELNSFLLLGNGVHLTLSEIRKFPTLFGGVQLLTLSACNTGLGNQGDDGSEVESLGVLAQRQGARAVIASLWAVADQSTSVLMQEFYRLRESEAGMSKLEALQEAQLELLRGSGRAGSVDGGNRGQVPPGDRMDNLQATRFVYDPKKPYAHPYYWAPFFLMGNWL
jgi:CHAT domain-containing protein/predicted negative regulator of RcsB-dependent stress response